MTILTSNKDNKTKTATDISQEINDNVTIRGLNELFNVTDENIDIKTELEPREIRQILRLKFMAKEFKIIGLDKWIIKFMRLRLSKERKSRKEIIDMIKADLSNEIKMMGNYKGALMRGIGGRM